MWILFIIGFQKPALGLEDLIELARKNNKNLAAIDQQYVMQDHVLEATGYYPEPKVSVGLYAQPVETRVGPQRFSLGVSQQVPYPGILKAQRNQAQAVGNTILQRRQQMESDLILAIRRSWYDLYYEQKKLEINKENLNLMKRMEEVTRSQFRTGQGAYAFVVQAQTQLANYSERVDSGIDDIRALEARIRGLVGITGDLPIGNIDLANAPEMAGEGLQPLLAILDAQMAEVDAASELQAFDFKPKLRAGLTYIATGEAHVAGTPGSGDDPLIATVEVSLPLQRKKYRAGMAVHRAHRLALEQQRSQVERDLRAQIESHSILLSRAERKVHLYEGTLLPKALEALQSTIKAFRSGQVEFSSVIEVQRDLLQFKLDQERSRADAYIHRADLQWLRSSGTGGKQ